MMIIAKDRKQQNGVSSAAALLGGVLALGLFVFVLIQIGLISLGGGTAVSATTQTLITQDMRFDQPELTVKAGEVVAFQLRNGDLFEHSFDIDALDVHVPLGSRDSAFVEFTVPEPGVYQFYCDVPGHVDAGMVGTLIVK